jgi:DNA-binding transcriptional ArsR family regulator
MVSKLGIEQSVLSKHLLLLKQAGVLASRQEKTTVYYRVHDEGVHEVLHGASEILRGRLIHSKKILEQMERPAAKRKDRG